MICDFCKKEIDEECVEIEIMFLAKTVRLHKTCRECVTDEQVMKMLMEKE